MSPPDNVIAIEDMESEDSRPAEHPATSDASPAGSRSVGQLNDRGSVIKLGMSADESARAVNVLSNGEKCKLLTDHFQPSANFPFPKVFSNGCNRQFQHKWLSRYPWLVYNKDLNGGFCKFCALFAANRAQHGALVNRPITAWIKVQKIVDGHERNLFHANAVMAAKDFQRSVENLQVNIDVLMNTQILDRIQEK